jgi:flagellar assembly factor FliW
MTTTMTLKEPTVTTIAVKTLFKGVVEVPEESLISFISPMLGFEKLRRFLIYQTQPGPLYWMQSVEDERTAFCILSPFQAGLDPDFELVGEDVADLGANSPEQLDVFTIVVLDPDPALTRTNLRAPILVGRQSRLAKQIVLNDGRLPIRFFLRDIGAKPTGR